jgi:hypothetical protein
MTERTEIFIALVESFAHIWYDGRIPADRTSFVARLVESYMPESTCGLGPLTAEEWLRERDEVALHITTAVDCVARQRTLWAN